MKSQTKILIGILIVLIFTLAVLALYAARSRQGNFSMPYDQTVTLAGEAECVPKKGPGPHTQECMLGGFRAADGNHYVLRGYERFVGNGALGVSGTITGILRRDNSGQYARYDIQGIIEVTSVLETQDKEPASVPAASADTTAVVRAELAKYGTARVIILLKGNSYTAPEYTADDAKKATEVKKIQDRALKIFTSTDFELEDRMTYVPAVSGVINIEGLEALLGYPEFESINLDQSSSILEDGML